MSGPGYDEIARAALPAYGLGPDAELRLVNLSENATYFVTAPDGRGEQVMRVHRDRYHSAEAIASELDWVAALAEDTGVRVAPAITAADGSRVVTVEAGGIDRHVVMFERLPGAEPNPEAVRPSDFRRLGEITARLHAHARGWRRPFGFTRFDWGWATTLGERGRWGSWEDGFGMTAPVRVVLAESAELVRRRLESYGAGPDRFGLVHADLRLANLLVDGDEVSVIDFDDCGESWFMYDFGTAVSFVEDDPRLPLWQEAWVSGYRSVVALDDEHVRMLPTFVMLRRLLLVAWLGSHAHSREARSLGPAYTEASVVLAQRYLASGGRVLVA